MNARTILPPGLCETLKAQNQNTIMDHLATLAPELSEGLVKRLGQIQWEEFHKIYEAPELSHVEPAQVVCLKQREREKTELERIGLDAYMNGQVAVLLVAGGEGSRLGLSGPKGCFEFGPISSDSLYQKHAEKILAISRRTGHDVPFILMTSPSTHFPTVEFFEQNAFFGLNPAQVRFFQQDTVPTTNTEGQLLLKSPGQLLENPNGHGGSIDGLISSLTLDWLNDKKIKDLVYLQVDNVLAPAFDTFAIGLRRANSSDLINKVIKKASPEEKVGALVRVDGKDSIIEYSDLTPAQKLKTTKNGEFLFGWGNVAAHIVSIEFLTKLQHENFTLPFHQAIKDIEAWNGSERIKMTGIKRERFFFDILALGNNIGLEISRSEEFAPLKNASGADSIDSARLLACDEHRRWLKSCGVTVGNEVTVEIRPQFAATKEELVAKLAADPSLKESLGSLDKILL